MMDSIQLIERLSGLYELSEGTQDALLSTSAVQNESQPPEIAPSTVGLAPRKSIEMCQRFCEGCHG